MQLYYEIKQQQETHVIVSISSLAVPLVCAGKLACTITMYFSGNLMKNK